MLNNILTQIIALHSYDEVKIVCIGEEKDFKRLEELPDWDYRGTWFRSSEGIWFSAMIPGQEPRFTVTIGVSDIALKKDRRIQEKIVKLFQYTLEHLESGGEEGAYSSS